MNQWCVASVNHCINESLKERTHEPRDEGTSGCGHFFVLLLHGAISSVASAQFFSWRCCTAFFTFQLQFCVVQRWHYTDAFLRAVPMRFVAASWKAAYCRIKSSNVHTASTVRIFRASPRLRVVWILKYKSSSRSSSVRFFPTSSSKNHPHTLEAQIELSLQSR